MQDITAIILTFNEEIHIARCVESIRDVCKRICVIDSHSTDRTREIAQQLGADVFINDWVSYAPQFNWALDHCDIKTTWVLRIDADEYLLPELCQEMNQKLPALKETITGIYLKRRMVFLGKWIQRGTMYPRYMLRLWRNGLGRCEERWMDEHICLIHGLTCRFTNDFADENLNPISWWIGKHNSYASREVVDQLNRKYGMLKEAEIGSEGQAAQVRWLKKNVYERVPKTVRSLIYFLYRYILRLGFLDGVSGLIFHFNQGLWYRALVDTKVFAVERRMKSRGIDVKQAIHEELGIKLTDIA